MKWAELRGLKRNAAVVLGNACHRGADGQRTKGSCCWQDARAPTCGIGGEPSRSTCGSVRRDECAGPRSPRHRPAAGSSPPAAAPAWCLTAWTEPGGVGRATGTGRCPTAAPHSPAPTARPPGYGSRGGRHRQCSACATRAACRPIGRCVGRRGFRRADARPQPRRGDTYPDDVPWPASGITWARVTASSVMLIEVRSRHSVGPAERRAASPRQPCGHGPTPVADLGAEQLA
jgi:hypothetical protein